MHTFQDSLGRRWRRRALSISAVALAGCLAIATLPLWLPVLALSDAVRGSRWAGVRCGVFVIVFAGCELLGLLGAAWILTWTRQDSSKRLARLYALQRWWSGLVFRRAQGVFDFRLEVDGEIDFRDRPLLVFARHRSMADTLLPSIVVSNVYKVPLRYVMKRELLLDPCLDIVGQQLPNYFVERESDDSGAEVERVAELARGVGPGEGVLIFPEGTRFTPKKRARIIEKLRARGDDAGAARAEHLKHVLLPKRGGPLALLEAAPEADVILLCHVGFEAAGTFPSLWRGDLVGAQVKVHCKTVACEAIPESAEARERWLYDEWAEMDRWLEAIGHTEINADIVG